MVDGQPTLVETLDKFDTWMKHEGLISKEEPSSPLKKFVFVTCGDWDLKTMLPGECRFLCQTVPWYFSNWVNVKRPFADATGQQGKGMMRMLTLLGIQHTGRHHSGIDDCRNIAEIVKNLISQSGVIF